jgi:hypothetical protein
LIDLTILTQFPISNAQTIHLLLDSPGRFIPLKAYILLLLNSNHSSVKRFESLSGECRRRMLKRLMSFGAQNNNNNKNNDDKDDDNDDDNDNDDQMVEDPLLTEKITSKTVARRVALTLLEAVRIFIVRVQTIQIISIV